MGRGNFNSGKDAPGYKHGLTKTPEYRVWGAMVSRCRNPTDTYYGDYGGRGIKVWEPWYDFAKFFADVGPRPSPRHSLDRIQNSGNYEPGNVRWATADEQANNRRTGIIVDYLGTPCTIAQAVRSAGSVVGADTAAARLERGWPMPEAVEMPRQTKRPPMFPSYDLGFPRGVP